MTNGATGARADAATIVGAAAGIVDRVRDALEKAS